eukprot:gb/GECH01013755.1/.p1 GENE.gb/GECH01013755.1/~~gb/GECH01013755.1/.p1  ORF type:complete len:1598 (+),score=438.48 gb/GECH01013755.1/:1-4794(+)
MTIHNDKLSLRQNSTSSGVSPYRKTEKRSMLLRGGAPRPFRHSEKSNHSSSSYSNMTMRRHQFNAVEFMTQLRCVQLWMSQVLAENQMEDSNIQSLTPSDFIDSIADGAILCRVANRLHLPKSVPDHQIRTLSPSSRKQSFKTTDNIIRFLDSAKSSGLTSSFLFDVADLYEKKNLPRVIGSLYALALCLEQQGIGPQLNLDISPDDFTAEEIQSAQTIISSHRSNQSSNSSRAKGLLASVFGRKRNSSGSTQSSDSGDSDDEIPDPEETILEGLDSNNSVRAGADVSFDIISRDKLGNDVERGGRNVTCTLTHVASGDREQLNVSDLGNGKYRVSFSVSRSGTYEIGVKLDGRSIHSSPFQCHIIDSGKTDVSHTTVTGSGLTSAVSSVNTTFLIETHDSYGNRREEGGDPFRVRLEPYQDQGSAAKPGRSQKEKIDADVIDNGDGSYTVNYRVESDGEYRLFIEKDDTAVADSPYQINVKNASVSDPSKCRIVDPDALSSVSAGSETEFTLETLDKNGNPCCDDGNDIRVSIELIEAGDNNVMPIDNEDAIRIEPDIIYESTGRYQIKFLSQYVGKYRIQILMGDTPISGSPFDCQVEEAGVADPSKCSLSGAPIEQRRMIAGEAAEIVIKARDPFGNRRTTGGEDIESSMCPVIDNRRVTASDLSFKTILPANLTDEGNGIYRVRYLPTDSHLFMLSLKLDDEHILESPYEIDITDTGATDTSKCLIRGDGFHGGVCGEDNVFTIDARDKHGNQRNSGGDQFKIDIINEGNGNSVPVRIEDCGNGSYEVHYTPVEWGMHSVVVKLDKEILPQGENQIHVEEPPSVSFLTPEVIDNMDDYQLQRALAVPSSAASSSDEDNLIPEIQNLKRQIVDQIRMNNSLEKDIRELDNRIALLIRNRITIQEVFKYSSGLKKYKKSSRKHKQSGDSSSHNLSSSDTYKKKLDAYGALFYLLQTEPQYLARCVFLVGDRHVEPFLGTVIFTLFGYGMTPRDEYLLLRFFKQTLQAEISISNTVGGFLEDNPVITKMVLAYSRAQGQEFLREKISKWLDPILSSKTNGLELEPLKVLQDYTKEQLRKGRKPEFDLHSLNNERALEIPQVAEIVTKRANQVEEICTAVIDGLCSSVDELPYGLRWICRELSNLLKRTFPSEGEEAILRVISEVIYFRFINPAIVSPDEYKIVSHTLDFITTKNLIVVSKLLHMVATNRTFGKTTLERYMDRFNPFILKMFPRMLQFIRDVIDVPDPEDRLQVHRYVELTQKTAPQLSISVNEIHRTHRMLEENVNKLAPESDDPMRAILEELGSPPEEDEEDDDEEVLLSLVTRFDSDALVKNEINDDQILDETKELVRRVLKDIPPKLIGTELSQTLKNAKNHAGHAKSQSENLAETVRQALNNLDVLEEHEKLPPQKDKYHQLLKEVAQHASDRATGVKQQMQEIKRLKIALDELKTHSEYLQSQFNQYTNYLNDVRMKQMPAEHKGWKKKSKKRESSGGLKEYQPVGPFKFSFHQLKKKGVIKDIEDTAQANNLKFVFNSEKPGEFKVEATIKGETVNSLNLEMDLLLEKQFNGISEVNYDGLVLDVDTTIEVLNKLLLRKK